MDTAEGETVSIDENAVKTSAIQYLVQTGWLVIRINSGAGKGEWTDKHGETRKRFWRFVKWFAGGITDKEGDAGVSDILAIKPGMPPMMIETKRPGKKSNVSYAQITFMGKWAEHGGVSLAIECIEDLIEAIENLEVK